MLLLELHRLLIMCSQPIPLLPPSTLMVLVLLVQVLPFHLPEGLSLSRYCWEMAKDHSLRLQLNRLSSLTLDS